MAYRFDKAETVENGLRRIAREQIDEALGVIRSTDLPLERIIHEVRRRCKALRALIRLVRPGFADYARENAVFRGISNLLAHARDGQVLAETLEELVEDDFDEATQRLVVRLRQRFTRQRARAAAAREALAECAMQLAAARTRVTDWTLGADGWDALSGGFAKTARAARHAMKALADEDDAECSHEWRKHAKYHWHHMRLLRGVAPHAAEERIKAAERLSDLLGERHDFDMFVATLAGHPRRSVESVAVGHLAAKARKRTDKLQERARKIGETLFDEKARKLAEAWGERWYDWARVEEAA